MMPAHPISFVLTTKTKLIYRGQLDDSRPGNGIPLSGNDLRGAIDGVIYNRKTPIKKPSMGCNIKWSSVSSRKKNQSRKLWFFLLC
jgi:hypothetical protein